MKKSELRQLIKESIAEMGGLITNRAMIIPDTPFNAKSKVNEEDEPSLHMRAGNNIQIRANAFMDDYINLCSRYELMLNVNAKVPMVLYDRETTKQLQQYVGKYVKSEVDVVKYQK